MSDKEIVTVEKIRERIKKLPAKTRQMLLMALASEEEKERPPEELSEIISEEENVMFGLAKQMGRDISDEQVWVVTELNNREIYALSGLLATIREGEPDWDPIEDFAKWFVTLRISRKRRAGAEIVEAMRSIGIQIGTPEEKIGRWQRLNFHGNTSYQDLSE